MLGLTGERPATLCPDRADATVAQVRGGGSIPLDGSHAIAFDEARDLRFLQRERLPFHSNAMRFTALAIDGSEVATQTAFSIGGGAVVYEHDIARNAPPEGLQDVPYSFSSGDELLAKSEASGLSIAAMMRANELAALAPEDMAERLAAIRAAILNAQSGDGVLIAGKGHEDYQILGTEKIHFDDREQAKAALMERRG